MRRTRSHVSGLGVEASLNDKSSPSSAEYSEMDAISEKVQRLCRVPKSAIEYHLTPAVSYESIRDRNSLSVGTGSSDVVFVLGENEKLVGLKRKAVPPAVSLVPDVTTAEEVVAERAFRTERGAGRVALGDQITALAGEFLNRCKEGIRLAGRAADSIGVVGGQTTLRVGKAVHYSPEGKEIPKATCDNKTTNGVIVHVEDPFCSISVHGGVHKNGRVDFLNERSTFPCSAWSTLTRNCNSKECCERTHVLPDMTGLFKEVSGCVGMWSLESRTAECNGVEELVQGLGQGDHRTDSQKKGVVGRVCNVFPLVDTSGLPSFEEMATVELPMPKSVFRESKVEDCKCGLGWGLASSLLGASTDHYIPHMVLQGITCTSASGSATSWENRLRRDLTLSVQYPVHHCHPYLLQELACSPFPVVTEPEVVEAVCVVGNTDKWEVQVVSSRSCLVDRPGTLGVRVGMSQLVANMLESLLILWRLRTPPEYCLLHLESKLREIWLRSHSLAQLLLTTEFCNMARVTTALDLEANDVPLLLAVASTHTPQVTLRYGLSFR